jgi:HPt (histidine-containing phosphotransfer) domain-containing protein
MRERCQEKDVGNIDGYLDIDAALRRLGEDHDFLRELYTLYIEDAPDRLATLKKAIAAEDQETMVKAAHSLKGISATICAPAAQQAAMTAESTARDGDLGALQSLIPGLESTVDTTVEHIRDYLAD